MMRPLIASPQRNKGGGSSTSNQSQTPRAVLAMSAFGILVAAFVAGSHRGMGVADEISELSAAKPISSVYKGPRVKVFTAFSDRSMAGKQRQDLSFLPKVEHVVMTTEQQGEFIRSNKECGGEEALKQFQTFNSANRPHLATELWKYCALYIHGGMYLDSESPLMDTLDHVLAMRKNVAVLNDLHFPDLVHGSLLLFQKPKSNVAKSMLEAALSSSVDLIEASPFLLPAKLYSLIANESSSKPLSPGHNGSDWFLLQHRCTFGPSSNWPAVGITSYQLESLRGSSLNCPEPNGLCCSVSDAIGNVPIIMTKHVTLPYQVIPTALELNKPYNAEAGHYSDYDLPYISTIREKIHMRPEEPMDTPNFYQMMEERACLPNSKACSDCLRDKKGANCKKCAHHCPCYCKALCHDEVPKKFVSKEITVTPPLYARDPSRIVPRIVHQTWFEDVTPDKYPNMSRLIESFKQSGWEYKFYTDDEATNFLSTHFPSEVREAYEALIPGAFKADLFRYCVLLIHGGVYADMDIMLESNLDISVGPDIGFMVPQDEPGTPVNRRMCLWNGFIAAAPGHPFLAKTIETVVNNVRNRFTSVDTDNMFCPKPELSLLHAFDTLFTAGPCMLGAMMNKVLGRHGQTAFRSGEIHPWSSSNRQASVKGTDFVLGTDDLPDARIPGRTIILHQNKWDMGSHRFTLRERNLVVASTDMPDADDRANQAKPKEHYSKTHAKVGIYGVERLYTNDHRANEELRFFVDAQRLRQHVATS